MPGTKNQMTVLLDAIAERENADPLGLTPLADVIDPEGLESILGSETNVSVSFEYMGYAVRMDSGGNVEIE